MEKQSKQLKVWRAVGISAIVALVIVSTLLVVSTTRKNPVKSDLVGEDGMLFAESGINTDANPDSTSSSAPDWIRSDVRISYLGPAGTYTEEAAVFFFGAFFLGAFFGAFLTFGLAAFFSFFGHGHGFGHSHLSLHSLHSHTFSSGLHSHFSTGFSSFLTDFFADFFATFFAIDFIYNFYFPFLLFQIFCVLEILKFHWLI